MLIKKIEISNFKSFKHLTVELGRFNVLIGANAAGKSNFIKIFKFLRDIIIHGLDNAISLQGGAEYLRNISLTKSNNDIVFKIQIDPEENVEFHSYLENGAPTNFGYKIDLLYNFRLNLEYANSDKFLFDEELIYHYNFYELINDKIIKLGKSLGSGEFIIMRNHQKISLKYKNNTENLTLNLKELLPVFFTDKNILENLVTTKNLLLELHYWFDGNKEYKDMFKEAAIYDFDPRLPKQATSIIGKADLDENGENLTLVLRRIIADEEKKRKLFNMIGDILPFVENLDVEKMFDKTLLLKLKEVYSEKHFLPSSLISDGTINILATIIALYFENKPLAIFEEAERRIHPYLISKMVDMMKDASTNKQIIVTTHNPEIVKYAGFELENILLVSRDNEGYSTIIRPHEKEEIMAFLQNEIGIEDLYVQNLLS